MKDICLYKTIYHCEKVLSRLNPIFHRYLALDGKCIHEIELSEDDCNFLIAFIYEKQWLA